ncbi:hypothetical protein Tco_1024239, partial [Tanacetum coccineum]
NGYSRKRAKRKPKTNKSKHGVERAKAKVIKMKKIQLEGLKLPKPQVVLQKRKTRVKIAKKTQKESVLVVRVQRNNDPGPSNSLGFFRSHPSRRIKLGELWDCQLGNLTAGKDSGGGGKGLSMGWFGL